jgi:uncharacterized membrane protein
MIILLLIIILSLLAIIIGKKRGIKALLALLFNYLIIIMTIVFICWGFNIYLCCYVSSILISMVTIFYLNGYNVKTVSSFISIIILIIIMSFIIWIFNSKLRVQGFAYEQLEEISGYSFNLGLDMQDIFFLVVMFAVVGAIADTSMAISSAIYEINENKKMKLSDLFASGMNVGKDILGTTINTLFFAFIGGFLGFILWHPNASLDLLINYKDFAANSFEILCSAIGCIMIIPITDIISAYLLKHSYLYKYFKLDV